jgi:asparagine synthase (glutamine-hydrolysing)
MCGIAGYFSLNGDLPDFKEKTLKTLLARGPEGHGYVSDGKVALLHTRLGVISPGVEGQQPFCSSDQRYWLVLNGEILNYAELKDALWKQGAVFTSPTDTEVLLIGLVREGIGFLNKVRGFFALAWYDSLLQRLVLARDHAGIKPLFWAKDSRGFYFASHSQAVLSMGFKPIPDLVSLSAFLEFHFIPPERSMWEGLQALPPGYYRIVSPEGSVDGQWLKEEEAQSFHGKRSDSFLSVFKTSIQRNVVADVPLGIFLSGGLDSSCIAAGVKHFTEESPKVFTLKQNNTWLDESEKAHALAKRYGWNAISVELQSDTALSWLEQMSEPVGDPAAIGLFRLSQVAAQEVKVVLSGDGADELFHGYARYKAWKMAANLRIPRFPLFHVGNRESSVSDTVRKGLRFLHLLMLTEGERYRYLCGFRPRDEVNDLLKDYSAYHFPPQFSIPASYDSVKIRQADLAFVLPGNMLPKSDLASMQNGLELRVPYLDEDLVRMSIHLPNSFKTDKDLLKQYWKQLEGQDFKPNKRGFDISLSTIFTGKLLARWKDLTDPQLLKDQGVFKSDFPSLGKDRMSLEQAWAWMAWQSVWERSKG